MKTNKISKKLITLLISVSVVAVGCGAGTDVVPNDNAQQIGISESALKQTFSILSSAAVVPGSMSSAFAGTIGSGNNKVCATWTLHAKPSGGISQGSVNIKTWAGSTSFPFTTGVTQTSCVYTGAGSSAYSAYEVTVNNVTGPASVFGNITVTTSYQACTFSNPC